MFLTDDEIYNGRFFVSRFELEGNRLQMHKRRLPSVGTGTL